MLEHLPEDVQSGLDAARTRALRRGTRLCVHVNDQVFPILKLWETGFSVDPARVPKLRGLVDIFDGPRHISQALIIAADEENGRVVYDFKRETVVGTSPIRDYVEEKQAPAGLLAFFGLRGAAG